jgi:GTPase-associated protein 1, N-terminal domain type 2/GTPase-associated protein 1, middle domain
VGQSGRHAVGPGGEQFYVTHCAMTDSVLNNPGYTVRAASVTDPARLKAAFHYPPYELPIDMWRDLPLASAAPRRLARTQHPDEGVWVVYSAYLEKDTVGRDRSYFSHLLHLPDADPAEVLRSWGADGWTTSYAPGAPKSLPGDARLPVGALVSDAALTAFLGEAPAGPTDASVTVCPQRLRANATARRELFARALAALLLLAEEEREQRRRVYIHAEPGLIALLLYGAVRLLPPAVTDNLTFSTFEPFHRNIRDYKLAEVVGTFLGAADKGLDPDLGTSRGIALDTFALSRSSPELRGPVSSLPAGVSDLVELAVAGEWALLPVVRHAVGADPSGLSLAGIALARARGLAQVDAGTATIDVLLALQADAIGAKELKSRAEIIWPLVKSAALARAEVRSAFRELLAEPARVKEFWDEAIEAILQENYRKWDARWSLIRAVAGNEEARRLLHKLIGSEKNEEKLTRLPTDTRSKLRAACTEVVLLPPRTLLLPIGLGELEPLLAAPPEWAGYTAFVLMAGDDYNWLPHIPPSSREQMRTRARAFLLTAPGPAIASYVHAARPYLDADPAFLATLFTPYSASAATLMDKLLATTTLDADDWMKLCTAVGLTQDEWGEFLLEGNHLANLLIGLGGDGLGRDVWAGYLDALTPALIAPDLVTIEDEEVEPEAVHEWERKVYGHLRLASERLTKAEVKLVQSLPEGGVARLFAANALLRWVEDPGAAERDGADEVMNACAAFGVERSGLVRAAFRAGEFGRVDPVTEASRLTPVIELFKACFAVDANFHTAQHAAIEIIRLSAEVPKSSRGDFQARFLLACVPDIHFLALLDDQRRQQLEPVAEARIRQYLASLTKKSATKYVPPAATKPSAAEPVEDEEQEEETTDTEPSWEKSSETKAKKSGCAGMLLAFAITAACALTALAR